jgi:hypothetical protein
VVTNNGNTPLAGPVTIADNKVTGIVCPNVNTLGNLDNNLDLNESITCTGTYRVTQGDLNAGSVSNNATATVGGVTSTISSTTVPMGSVIMFATGTALALTTSPDPMTATVSAALTQIVVPTQTVIPTSTALPSTGGGGEPILGHAYSSIEIQDGPSCSSQSIHIKMTHGFAPDQPVEPAILTVSEEGSFHKIAEKQISLNVADSQGGANQEIAVDLDIPDAKGSYLIYIDHPQLTFDSVIMQHLPDCHGNLIDISYDIPSEDLDGIEKRPDLKVNFSLVAWGPNPGVKPPFSEDDGVAKMHLSGMDNTAKYIFWVQPADSGQFELLQNDDFLAVTSADYLVGVTFGGRTVSIPFRLVTPYLNPK